MCTMMNGMSSICSAEWNEHYVCYDEWNVQYVYNDECECAVCVL